MVDLRRDAKICALHSFGLLLSGALGLLLTLVFTGDAWHMVSDEQLGSDTAFHLFLQAVVFSLGWPLLLLSSRCLKRLRREFSTETIRVMSHRGTAMTETLIAMPVVFLLSFGLAQFAVNNIAAVMMNYATFSASRAAWIWEGEGDLDEAAERARIAAAAALTPVAYGGSLKSAEAETDSFRQARGILVASQYPVIFDSMGANGVSEGEQLVGGSNQKPPSLAGALVETSFKARSAQQMTAAYRSTIVEVVELGNDMETTVRYQHFIAMPLVGRVFGEYGVIQGRLGYWMLFERTYKRARMTESNRNIEGLIGEDLIPRLL